MPNPRVKCEKEVIELLAKGVPYSAIARQLGIGNGTVARVKARAFPKPPKPPKAPELRVGFNYRAAARHLRW